MTKKALKWVTADKKEIAIKSLGDSHLVNILKMIEDNLAGYATSSGTLPPTHIKQYPELSQEALDRGLFRWVADRKYLPAIKAQVEKETKTP